VVILQNALDTERATGAAPGELVRPDDDAAHDAGPRHGRDHHRGDEPAGE
jgi:hypothetical protein